MPSRSSTAICVGILVLGMSALASADIVSLKDGNVIECIIKETTKKQGRDVLVVELENGSTRDIPLAQVAWVSRGKPSWIRRKEALERYARMIERLEKKPKVTAAHHETIARFCKREGLTDKADKHFRKAYEIRKREANSRRDHEELARWAERRAGLFDAAAEQWRLAFERFVQEEKARAAEKGEELDPGDYYRLGRYAEKHALYPEAEESYSKCLFLDPSYRTAARAMERLKKLQATLVNSKLFRTIKPQLLDAAAVIAGKQNPDGSYGGDASEAGVQGLRGMTALCALALIHRWEAEGTERPDAMTRVPKELEKAIDFMLVAETNAKKLRGPDVWGNVWALHLFAKILRKRELKAFHGRVREKLNEIFDGLQKQMSPQGGWMYYNFARRSPASFVTGVGIIGMIELKREKVSVPEPMFAKCLALLKRLKQSDGVWMYRTGTPQSVQGSQGRASLCELALYMAGEQGLDPVRTAVSNFFKYRHILQAVKGKKATHIGKGGTAPYYYLFGHYWTSRAIQILPAEERDATMTRLRDLYLQDQEEDGAFSDFPVLRKHYKTYGSAFGVMTLFTIGTLPPRNHGPGRR